MGIREKKKKRIRKSILDAAGNLFMEQGFNDSSIQDIAARADIGVGTVYNYFKSKTDIYVELLLEEFSIDELYDFSIDGLEGVSLGDLLLDKFEKILTMLKKYNKTIIKEMFNIALKGGIDGFVFKTLFNADMKYLEDLSLLISKYLDLKDYDIEMTGTEIAESIYSAFAYEMMLFIYDNGMTYDDMIARCEKKLRFITRGL